MMSEEYTAAQVLEKIGSLQAIHDRSVHFTEIQAQALLSQAMIDRLQGFQGTEINFIDSIAQQYHVLELIAPRAQAIDPVLELADIGKIQTLIHTH